MIVVVLRDAARSVLLRMMDAVDPAIVSESEEVLREVPGVEGLGRVRLRWIGHRLHAEAEVTVDEGLTVAEGHDIAERARHALLHEVPHLSSALIHADPCGHDGRDAHAELAHHDARAPRRSETVDGSHAHRSEVVRPWGGSLEPIAGPTGSPVPGSPGSTSSLTRERIAGRRPSV